MMRWGIAGALLALATPVAAEILTVTGSYPPGQSNINDLFRIAVERFDGPDGPALAQSIEDQLGLAHVGGRAYYRVIAIESDAPIDGLLTGTVRTSVEESTVLEKRTNCTKPDPADKKKCLKEVETDIRCRLRVASINTNVRLVAIADGSVRYTRPMTARDEQTFCPDRRATRTVEEFVDVNLRSQTQAVRRDLAPSGFSLAVRVDEDRKGLIKAAQNAFKAAIRQTKTDPAGACARWSALTRDAPPTAALAFNLGLCAEVARDFDTAISWYGDALRLGSRRNDIPAALARIDRHRLAISDWDERKQHLGDD